MRTQRMALGLALTIGGLAAEAAYAEDYRGTMEQQMACTPDVWRLCSQDIPDVNRIVACLRQNTPRLSDGCRAVFETNNQIQTQRMLPRAVPPRRMAPPVPMPQDDEDE